MANFRIGYFLKKEWQQIEGQLNVIQLLMHDSGNERMQPLFLFLSNQDQSDTFAESLRSHTILAISLLTISHANQILFYGKHYLRLESSEVWKLFKV